MLLTLSLPLLFLACSTKNDDPAPDAGTAVSGTYELRRSVKIENDNTIYDYKFPTTSGTVTQSGTLTISRSSATAVYVEVTLQVQQPNKAPATSTTTFGKMDVKSAATGYELSQFSTNNQKTASGTGNGSDMTIELSDTYLPTMTTTRYIVEAKR